MGAMVALRLLCLLSVVDIVAASFSCKDQSNHNVDWFYGYKLPELRDHPSELVNQGYGLMYFDNNTAPGGWKLSQTDMYYSGQAIGYTLQQYYANSKRPDVFYMLYNDEHPSGGYSSTHAHAKGVLLCDADTCVWLVHSLPKFPQLGSYAFAQNARYYGQSALCLTLPYSELSGLGKLFYQEWPYMYAWNMPSFMEAANPDMANVLKGLHNHAPPFNARFSLVSSGGTKFVYFAKSGYWGKDLYYDYVAPSLGVSLVTETWQNGRGNFTSWCSGPQHVNNVFHITLPGQGIDFSDHKDHSKFAVSTDPSKPWVCVGDINRQHGQLKRGGGTVCQLNRDVWAAYNASVTAIQPCSPTPSDRLSNELYV